MLIRSQQNLEFFTASAFLAVGWYVATRWGANPLAGLAAFCLAVIGTTRMTAAMNKARHIRGPRKRSPVPPPWVQAWAGLALAWLLS